MFVAWLESTNRTSRTQLSAKRKRLIETALAAYPLDDVLAAVQGWAASPWHRGENPTATVYNEIELLLRDAAHIERFRDLHRDAPHLQGVGDRARVNPRASTDADVARLLDRTRKIGGPS